MINDRKSGGTMYSGIYEGKVRHRRYEPMAHAFRAPLFLMYLDLDELPTVFQGRWFWSIERFNLATFRRRDHLGDPNESLEKSIRDLVEAETGVRPTGPIRLLTHLSYFGYCFNPLSIFFCFDEGGERLHSVVAEVTNTPWRERHCYVLSNANQTDSTSINEMKHDFRFSKAFHVSPFMTMDFEYRWALRGPGQNLILHAENWQQDRPCFDATLNLKRRDISTWTLASVLFRYPLMTVQVIANIHWQAFWLWWKRIPYVPHPKTCQSGSTVKNSKSDLIHEKPET